MNNCKNIHFQQDLCPCKAHPEANKWGEIKQQINTHGGEIKNKSITTGENTKNGKHAHFHQDLCPCKGHPEANKWAINNTNYYY